MKIKYLIKKILSDEDYFESFMTIVMILITFIGFMIYLLFNN